MSRETDSSSAGANARGGAAYPSGTPPYGTPKASEDGVAAGRSAARPNEPKTETTLTTRIRINIPGSRPIPPVVVRTPVAEVGPAESAEPAVAAPAPGPVSALSILDTSVEPAAAPPADEKTSDWFAPRKSGAPKGPQGGGSTSGAGIPGGSGVPAPQGASGGPGGAPGGPTGARHGTPAPSAPRPGASGPGAGRPGGTHGAGLPGAAGAGPVAPGHGGGTSSFDVSAAVASTTGSFPIPQLDGAGEPRRDNLPYFSGDGRRGPNGPTGGPVTGDGPGIGPPLDLSGPGFVGPGGPGGPGPRGPLGPGAPGPAAGQEFPGGGLSDDTAILTPQKPAPEPGNPVYGGPTDNVSGHTVTSGIPVVPSVGQNSPFGPGAQTEAPGPHTPPKLPDPSPAQSSGSSKKPAKKKGRSKLVVLGVVVFVIGGGAYGAGLLMNHSDVPKGTTVLGVDIGGGTRDEAVKKLDDAFGDSTDKPLKLSVDGDTVSLKPDQAGLQLDSSATVAAAAKSDYNPVSVIGSLFGQERVVEPVMPVDDEKLQAALEAAGGFGSARDGTIKFQSGKAVAVYGKAGKGIDVGRSTEAVEEAYRTQVETGTSPAVRVPTVAKEPTVKNSEVDRMMKAFAQPAMSANVMVQTDVAHSVPMSPQNSLWRFLGVKPVNGKLVEYYDKAALKTLYGNAFDGVLITRGTGKKTPVTVDDVISALRPALLGKTTAARIGVIDTTPN